MKMDQLNAVDEYTLFWVCNISNEHKNNPDNSFLNFDRAWYQNLWHIDGAQNYTSRHNSGLREWSLKDHGVRGEINK